MRSLVTVMMVLVLISAAAAITKVAATLDHRRYEGDVVEELTYFPSGRFLELADLGFGALIADGMWLRGIQYYGAHHKSDKAYPLAEHIFSTITDLDPEFISAYRFGGIVLSEDVGATGAAIDLLKKGIRSNPGRWELPFDLGFIYFVDCNDCAKAARYFSLASRMDNPPEITKRFTAFAFRKAGKTEVARALWQQLYDSTGNRVIKDAAAAAIKNIDLDTTVQQLSALVERFRQNSGRYPAEISDLVRAGLARRIPEDPFGGSYLIDGETHHVLSTSRVEDEAAKTVESLTKAIERFNRQNGRFPASLEELKSAGLIETVPEVEGARLAYERSTGKATCNPVWREVVR
ncbi:MAG TPA: hypothetical protein VMU02_00140 [bacterium]|nr:hypothetical protein [bacterium]